MFSGRDVTGLVWLFRLGYWYSDVLTEGLRQIKEYHSTVSFSDESILYCEGDANELAEWVFLNLCLKRLKEFQSLINLGEY